MSISYISYALPIILAAAGGYVTYLSGLLNIAAEGTIMLGAFIAYAVLEISGSYLIAGLSAVILAALLSYGYASLTLRLGGNIFITGLAVNLIFPGLIGVVSQRAFSTSGVLQSHAASPLSFADVTWLFLVLTVIVCIGVSYLISSTRAGLLIRSAGINARALEIRGGRPRMIQEISFAISGAANGLAGAFLTFSLQAFIPNISSGKGWLALAAIYLGGFTFRGTLIAVLIFSAAESAANAAQGAFELPASIFLGFPYMITFIGLVVRAFYLKRRG
jgi:simple sugar transport system permease protein